MLVTRFTGFFPDLPLGRGRQRGITAWHRLDLVSWAVSGAGCAGPIWDKGGRRSQRSRHRGVAGLLGGATGPGADRCAGRKRHLWAKLHVFESSEAVRARSVVVIKQQYEFFVASLQKSIASLKKTVLYTQHDTAVFALC